MVDCDGLQNWRKIPGPFIMGICPCGICAFCRLRLLLFLVRWMIFLSWVPIPSDLDKRVGGLLAFVASSRLSVWDNHVIHAWTCSFCQKESEKGRTNTNTTDTVSKGLLLEIGF